MAKGKTGGSTGTATRGKAPAKSSKAKATADAKYYNPPDEPDLVLYSSIKGGVFLVLAILCAVGLFTSDGAVVQFFSSFIKGLIGWGYWLLSPAFLICAIITFKNRTQPVGLKIFSALMIPVVVSAIISISAYDAGKITVITDVTKLFRQGQELKCGGIIAGLLAVIFEKAFSVYGAYALLLIAMGFFLMKALGAGLSGMAEGLVRSAGKYSSFEDEFFDDDEDFAPQGNKKKADAKKTAVDRASAGSAFPMDIPLSYDGVSSVPSAESSPRRRSRFDLSLEQEIGIPDEKRAEAEEELRRRAAAAEAAAYPPAGYTAEQQPRRVRRPDIKTVRRPAESPSDDNSADYGQMRSDAPQLSAQAYPEDNYGRNNQKPATEYKNNPSVAPAQRPVQRSAQPSQPAESSPEEAFYAAVRGNSSPAHRAPAETEKRSNTSPAPSASPRGSESDMPEYSFPGTDLLNCPPSSAVDAGDEILTNRGRLENALHSFGISANIAGITHGPTVTRYDIELDQGVKLARVTNLAGDLALSLGVVNVRIAPIPDKISTVGIEVPNKIVNTVYLREIIESQKFKTAKSKLSFAIGKDIAGECIVGNISKLPHMLIAGTTGSGKSVCMNSLILSLLYKAGPEEVKMLMIDPKMVELGVYNGIPHLYVPVVTDPKKASGALQWSVVEMLKRYRLFSQASVRDLETYNKYCDANGMPRLPAIVIVIDELADLMIAASKEVEESICRVAQMGRAAGMHLIIATQRPSADVITGLMKANIPSRIAFAVSSSLESRIILDQVGAEKLIGMGDMLYSPVGCGKPLRIQGAYVSDEEREAVIQFVKEECGSSDSSQEIMDFMNQAAEKGKNEGGKEDKSDSGSDLGYDEMLSTAVDVVIEMKSCSVSMLQRRVKLGYSRAARIVDQMEEIGVVGPYEGSKPRAVLVDREQWQEMKRGLGLTSDSDLDLARSMNED